MVAAMIIIFVIGYVLIALEHPLHMNKATFALLTCGILWSIYALMGDDSEMIHHAIVVQLGDACEIVVFLIGAMTIVEIIDRYGGFSFITEHPESYNASLELEKRIRQANTLYDTSEEKEKIMRLRRYESEGQETNYEILLHQTMQKMKDDYRLSKAPQI